MAKNLNKTTMNTNENNSGTLKFSNPAKKLIAFVLESPLPGRGGWGNGYVAVPKDHPVYRMDYDAIHDKYKISVNGGLTFSAMDIIGQPEETKGMWIVGFDTLHSHDTPVMWPNSESVMLEANNLKSQLEAIYTPAVKEETKHTPGPWQLTTIPFELRNTDSAAAIYGPMSIDGGACLIADISRSAGDAQATANARLIASAPDLLIERDYWLEQAKQSNKENQELKAENEELRRQSESDDKYIKSLEELKFELINVLDRIIGSMSLERVERFDLNELAKSAITKAKAQ